MNKKRSNFKELWIYDAYNIIHRCRLIGFQDEASVRLEMSRDRLISCVETHSVYYNCDARVVFDSSSRMRQKSRVDKVRQNKIEIIYSTKRMNADSIIERMVREEMNLKNYDRITIVTSDRMESHLVFGMGAQTCHAHMWFSMVRQIEEGRGLQ